MFNKSVSHKVQIQKKGDLIPLLKSIPAGEELELEVILDLPDTATRNAVTKKYEEFSNQARAELQALEKGRVLRIHILHKNGMSMANSLTIKFA